MLALVNHTNSITMKHLIFALLLVLAVNARAQTIKNNNIVIGSVDSVQSKILNENRKVWVYVPNGADDSTFAKKRYPVVYLLDGDGHFPSLTGIIQQLSQVNGNTLLPQMIVVGIPNTHRTRDLTPTNTLHGLDGKTDSSLKTSGGGEKFTNFIARELIPHIDSLYPTAPYKILIGHSFGGLTVINTLVNHTNMFNAYVAIDPSMWWDDQKLLKQTEIALHQKQLTGKTLYLGIANTMAAGMDTLKVRSDTSWINAHIRSILHLKDILQANHANGLQFAYAYKPNDSHGSVPLITEYDALRFIFSYYRLPTEIEVAMYDPKSKENFTALLDKHYQEISRHLGYAVYPAEDQINSNAYYFLQNNMPERAYILFALNIKNYPQSFNVYDSMGDYYAYKKDKTKAVEYFRKALQVKEVKDTRDKLNKLLAGK